MAMISYPQLVHNIGEAVKEKASLDSLKYGEIAQAILDITAGGVEYKSITANDNNTITAIDKEDNIHTATYILDDNGRIESISYDNKSIYLEYDENGDIVKIGKTEVDIAEIPAITPQPELIPDNYFKIGPGWNATPIFQNQDLPEELIYDFTDSTITSLSWAFGSNTNMTNLKKLTLIGNFSQITNYQYMCNRQHGLKEIIGELDLSSAADLLTFWDNCPALEIFSITPNSIFSTTDISVCPNLTKDTIISCANGLNSTIQDAIGITSTQLATMQSTLGLVENSLFVESDSGTTNLEDFIADVKGWEVVVI